MDGKHMNSLRLVLLGVAVLIAGLIGWRYGGALPPRSALTQASQGQASQGHGPEASRPGAERLATAPEYAPFYRQLEETFPGDQSRVVRQAAQRNAAAALSPDAAVLETFGALEKQRGILAAKASPDKLAGIFATRAAVMAELARESPVLCSNFLYGSPSDAFVDFAAGHRALIGAMVEAGLQAIADGRISQIDRNPPNDQDFALLERSLTDKGLTSVEIEALIDGKMPNVAIEDQRLCAIGTAQLEALRDLPEPARARILSLAARLMAHS
jgi:hypothetical protein